MSKSINNPGDPSMPFITIILISFIPASVAGLFSYYYFESMIATNQLTVRNINLIYSIILSFLSYISAAFICHTFGRSLYKRNSSKSIHNFKEFTSALHNVASEQDLLKLLYDYLHVIFRHTKISVYYKNTLDSEATEWRNFPQKNMPICNMNPRSCPVISQGKECFVNDIRTDLTCAFQLPFYKSGSYICLLLEINGNPYAVLQLYHHEKEYFDVDTVKDIKTYVDMITPILRDKNEMKDLNQGAYTDKLTQVKNRTYLEQEMEKFLQASNSSGLPLSIIMIDLDFFKNVNDNFGHPAGDCILMEFSNIILRCIRSNDVVCRYGGEEFVVILPNATPAYASSIAERIRRTVEGETMPVFQGIHLPRITCSLGISTYPDYAVDKITLMKSADVALYSAKHEGRNRVVTYDPYNSEMNQNLLTPKKKNPMHR